MSRILRLISTFGIHRDAFSTKHSLASFEDYFIFMIMRGRPSLFEKNVVFVLTLYLIFVDSLDEIADALKDKRGAE